MVLLLDKLCLLLSKMKEGAPIYTLGDPLVSLSLFRCLLHDGIVVSEVRKAWIWLFLRDNDAINKSLLLLDLLLLLMELKLHGLQFSSQEVVLLPHLLSRDCQQLVFFLSFDEVGSNSSELFLPLVDLVHVCAGLKPTLLNKLNKDTKSISNSNHLPRSGCY